MQHFTKFGREIRYSLLHALLLVSFLGTSAMYAQTSMPFKIWDKTIGGSGEDILSITISASDGGYILGGTSASGISGDKSAPNYGNAISSSDYWIAKVDENGNKLWDKTFGGTANEILRSIIATNDGGYILGGGSASPVSGNMTQPGKGKEDFWIVKINSQGVKEWDKRYGGSENDRLTAMVISPNGGYLLGGNSYSGISGDKTEPNRDERANGSTSDYWVVKIDDLGEKQWDKTFGGKVPEGGEQYYGNDFLTSIAVTSDGGYLLGGSTTGVDADRTCEPYGWEYGHNSDGWVVKISAEGTKLWDKCYFGYENDYLSSITPTTDGGFLIGGYGDFKYYGTMAYYAFHVTKINSDGDIQWKKLYGGEEDSYSALTSATATPDGGYLLVGYSSSNRGENKSEQSIGSPRYHTYDYWILKINASGESQWDKTLGGDKQDVLTAIVPTPNGDYLLAGHSMSSTFADKSEKSRGQNDFWIVKVRGTAPAPEAVIIDVDQTYNGIEITPIISNSQLASKVEFFLDGVKVGETSGYDLNITVNPAPGTHYLYTKVYDKAGSSTTSYTTPISVYSPDSFFYRGINLNGPEMRFVEYPYSRYGLDDSVYLFESSNAAENFNFQAKSFENQSVNLSPQADLMLTSMLRSSLYSTKTEPALFNFTNVDKGAYEVYLYVWEDNNAQTFSISVNGSLALANYNSGNKGNWAKLGPFKTNVSDEGTIAIKVEGGDANVSAIEVRRITFYESFYRAVNLNGPTYKINNLSYDGSAQAANFSYQARAFANQSVPLSPAVGGNVAQMVRSSLYATKFTPANFTFTNVPAGQYDVFAYVWEDNYSQDFYLLVDGWKQYFNSGTKGQWKIIGPLPATVTESGILNIEAGGGDANISAFELWYRGSGSSPASLNNNSASKTLVYPNSIKDILTVSLPETQNGAVSAKIVDITGRTYLDNTKNLKGESELTFKVPVNDMKTGIYFLHLQYQGKKEVIRLNKE